MELIVRMDIPRIRFYSTGRLPKISMMSLLMRIKWTRRFIVTLLETACLVLKFCSGALINIYSFSRLSPGGTLMSKDLRRHTGKVRVMQYNLFASYFSQFKIQPT